MSRLETQLTQVRKAAERGDINPQTLRGLGRGYRKDPRFLQAVQEGYQKYQERQERGQVFVKSAESMVATKKRQARLGLQAGTQRKKQELRQSLPERNEGVE